MLKEEEQKLVLDQQILEAVTQPEGSLQKVVNQQQSHLLDGFRSVFGCGFQNVLPITVLPYGGLSSHLTPSVSFGCEFGKHSCPEE